MRIGFSIKSRKNKRLYEQRFNTVMYKNTSYGLDGFLSVETFEQRKCELVHGDKLKILCEITEIFVPEKKILNLHCSTSDAFGILLESGKFSDMTLIVKDRSFAVHKAILAAQSEVFCAMFENDMKEKEEKRVEIKDIDYEVMEQVIYYIYTGKVKLEDLKGLVREVLAAAEKYALKGLKNIGAEVLRDEITFENALETLILADTYNAERLKNIALNFIVAQDINKIMETAGFQLLERSYQHLLKDILASAVKK